MLTGLVDAITHSYAHTFSRRDYFHVGCPPQWAGQVIISRTQDLKEHLTGTLIPTDVRGHQKEKSPHRELTIPEQYNDAMDTYAKKIVIYCHAHNIPCLPHLPSSDYGIKIIQVRSSLITSDILNSLYQSVSGNRLVAWWC